MFQVGIFFLNDFPGKQPDAMFSTPVWHPNIAAGFCTLSPEQPYYLAHSLNGNLTMPERWKRTAGDVVWAWDQTVI